MSTQAPVSADKFLDTVSQSGLLDDGALDTFRRTHPDDGDSKDLAAALVKAGLLTQFQVKHLLSGRHRGLVLGSYKLLDEIGRGGMGVVFLAEHKSLKRRAAVKVLTEPARAAGGSRAGAKAAGQLATDRFYREARTAAALSHPNIVRVFDVSQFGSVHYIAMEYVEGRTLAQMVDANGPLHFAQACDYVAQASAGLQEAHTKGLVHRDIKPDNLIVDKAGVLKILDLGLARVNDSVDDRLTAQFDPDAVLGTPDFIAPEQAVNGVVDIRADIYSLGVTFYALVTGRPPFSGTTAQKLMQHQLQDAPSLTTLRAKVPPELSQIIARMMAKKPADRFQTPADVIEALAPWLSADAVNGNEPRTVGSTLSRLTSRTKLPRPAGRPKWVVPAAAGGGLLAVAAVVAVFALGSKTPAPVPDAGPSAPAVANVTVNPPPMPAPAPPVPQGPATTVYALDLSGIEPFVLPMLLRSASDVDAPGRLPAPWRAESLRPGAATEFAIEVVDGVTVAAMRNVDGNAIVQFYTASRIAQQIPGLAYAVRVEYRTEGGAFGVLETRAGVSGALTTKKHPMRDTAGEWATVEFALPVVQNETPLFLFLHGLDVSAGNRMTFRTLSVLERTP